MLLSILIQLLTPEVSWQIRSGELSSPGGDPEGMTSFASSMVAQGYVRSAEIFWRNPSDLPATRYELLSALAWNGRYQLLRVIPGHSVPPDIAGSTVADKAVAVCTLGWMKVREDGYFHGEEVVSRGDIVILSGFISGVDPSASVLFLSDLEELIP